MLTLTANEKPIFQAMVWRLLGAREYVKFTSDQVAQDWLGWGLINTKKANSAEWANVAGAMRRSQRCHPAQQVLDQAFVRGESSRAWYERGILLDKIDGGVAGISRKEMLTELEPEIQAATKCMFERLTGEAINLS